MAYGICTSEGVYVIPRAKPEELHYTYSRGTGVHVCASS